MESLLLFYFTSSGCRVSLRPEPIELAKEGVSIDLPEQVAIAPQASPGRSDRAGLLRGTVQPIIDPEELITVDSSQPCPSCLLSREASSFAEI